MLEDLVRFIIREEVLTYYAMFGVAVMVLPMLAGAIWFHRRIDRTEGGRRLMRDHGEVPPTLSRSPIAAGNQIGQAARLFKGIQSGAYGGDVKDIYKVVWIVVGLWLMANVIVWGLPIYGQAVYGPAAQLDSDSEGPSHVK